MSTRRRRDISGRSGILPLHNQSLSHTSTTTSSFSVSCWYCNWKTSFFNRKVYFMGQKYSRALHVWFMVGIGFSLFAMLAAIMILFMESSLLVIPSMETLFTLEKSNNLLDSANLVISGISAPVSDAGCMFIGMLLSVGVHEFGHALAAASEGVHMEYVALFIAFLFPGAYVAFNNDLLEALEPLQLLRVYCAGVWHNIMLCVVCWVGLTSLPVLLYVGYQHGDNPMVLHVPHTSPLAGHISPGDVILAIDDFQIRTPIQWMQNLNLIHSELTKQKSVANVHNMNSSLSERGFCVPNNWLHEKQQRGGSLNFTCSGDELCFIDILRSPSNKSIIDWNKRMTNENTRCYCVRAKEVVKNLNCGKKWFESHNSTTYPCLKGESCVSPLLPSGSTLIEITFSKIHDSDCLWDAGYKNQSESTNSTLQNHNGHIHCKSSLLYEGNVGFLAYSVQLSSYRPRKLLWFHMHPPYWLPTVIEKFLKFSFYISAAVALLNSAPIVYLDGEYILDVLIIYAPLLPRMKKRAVNVFLFFCTMLFLISVVAGIRLLFL